MQFVILVSLEYSFSFQENFLVYFKTTFFLLKIHCGVIFGKIVDSYFIKSRKGLNNKFVKVLINAYFFANTNNFFCKIWILLGAKVKKIYSDIRFFCKNQEIVNYFQTTKKLPI